MSSARKVLLFGLVALGVVVGGSFLFALIGLDPYRIPSGSMEPTVKIGDRVLVKSLGDYEPERGDIVVFTPPDEANVTGAEDVKFIQRLVATEGDRVTIEGGRLLIDGERQDEPYIRPDATCQDCNIPRARTVPPDHVFVMGDNRGGSADSRLWGPVPVDSIDGEVVLRYWPPSRIGKP